MGKKGSVYQSREYKKALVGTGEKVLDVSSSFFAVEKEIKLPLLGKKKILEARGNPDEEDLNKINKMDYFYASIAPSVVGFDTGVFEKARYGRVNNYTILIDLCKSEEEIWKALDKGSIRWGVNFAKKNGLKFMLVEDGKMVDKFYELYGNTAKEGKFKAEGKEFLKSIVRTDIAKIFLIKKEDKIVAGGMILIDNDNNYSILDLTSVSEEGMKLQAMPFLYWNLILYSKSLKLNYFDLGGYDLEAKAGEKTWNINKFKDRFGGEVREQPVYSNNWKYPFFRSILKRFRFMKGWYKK